MSAWVGASKWLSEVHRFGSDEWLMCFMNIMTNQKVFVSPFASLIRGMFIQVCEDSSLTTKLIFFCQFVLVASCKI